MTILKIIFLALILMGVNAAETMSVPETTENTEKAPKFTSEYLNTLSEEQIKELVIEKEMKVEERCYKEEINLVLKAEKNLEEFNALSPTAKSVVEALIINTDSAKADIVPSEREKAYLDKVNNISLDLTQDKIN